MSKSIFNIDTPEFRELVDKVVSAIAYEWDVSEPLEARKRLIAHIDAKIAEAVEIAEYNFPIKEEMLLAQIRHERGWMARVGELSRQLKEQIP